jgi:hypothetical protein
MDPSRIWTPERRETRIGTGVSAPEDRFRRFVSAGAGTVYSTSPYGIPGAFAWYKADAETFQDSALTTPAVLDTAPVGGWKDQTGLTHHQLQATSTRRPTLRLAVKNGLAVVRFDGVDDYTKALFTLSTVYHIFLVVKETTWVLNGILVGGGVGDNFSLNQHPSTPNLDTWNGTSTSVSNAQLAVGSWGIVQILMGPSNPHMKINAGSNTLQPTPGSAGGLTIGAHNNPGSYSSIDVGELIVYNVALSDADETTVRNGLNARWAIF